MCYDPCLFGKAEIFVIFGLHFGRNYDLTNSFWIYLTFNKGVYLLGGMSELEIDTWQPDLNT